MKKIVILLFSLCALWSCEDVISIDLEEGEPKLVIEATAIQLEDQEEAFIEVKLTKTFPYFNNELPPNVSGAEITVEVNDQTFLLEEIDDNSGYYSTSLPMIYNQDYILFIEVEGEQYEATTQLEPTVPFDYVEQATGESFDPDLTSIKAYFTDPEDEENFYYFEFNSERNGRVLDNSDDELINGNQVSTFYADEFEVGDQVTISIQGISERFNNYISILLDQTDGGGNPFGTPPATIRGNIKNVSNPDNFPLGYFRISQEYTTTYTIQPE
ncbi:DUF4249 domain-containing protein [Mesonia aquimarina]|uniref:DUF4249 domain-containing protein n=1 Tax=Mesonia aquimarina TaxID=1504967 RepID=UPI000EF61C90|nr:DUF4249 domain-containing protein [Mesonia aquimarina]